MKQWTTITEVSGWGFEDSGGQARPIRVQYDGHLTPDEALKMAEEHGMNPEGYVTVEHKVVVADSKWYRPCLACHWTRKDKS